jgi:EpsI family protein
VEIWRNQVEGRVNGEKLGGTALIVVLITVGAFAWWLELRAPLEADASALATLPTRIGNWEARDIPLEPLVEAELRADLNLQRLYTFPTGEMVWLYLGYYGTARGGRPEHTPRSCYVSAGWGIEATRTLEVESNTSFRVNEYRVEKDGERRLVLFWFRSHRRTGMLGGFDQNVDRLLGRLLDGRADGALIRVSTPLQEGGEVAARSQLLSFVALLDPLIADRWPEERESGGGEENREIK